MAVKLIANYSKRLGLPGFSSHQFSVSVETEVLATDNIAAESDRLYHLLQDSVDQQIQSTGFVPPEGYGMDPSQARPSQNGNGQHRSGDGHQANGNGNGQHRNGSNGGDHWECTPGQAAFFKRIVNENHLDKNEVEQMSQQLFGVGARQCNKMQMAQLIDDLLEQTGQGNRRQRFTGRQPANRS